MDRSYINMAFLSGKISSDIDVHYIKYQTPVARFTLEVKETIGKDGNSFEHTSWHNIVAYDDMAKMAEQTLRNGADVSLCGRLVYRKYTTKEGITKNITEIRMSDFDMHINEFSQETNIADDTTEETWIFDAEKYYATENEPPI